MEMKHTFGAVAALFLGAVGTARADLATTTGGITIKTEDGRFEAKFGGRIHLDTNIPLDDDDKNIDEGIGEQKFDAYFRRARLTLEGKAYGWSYKFENDFAAQDDDIGSGFRELWIGTRVFDAMNVRFGQAKPYRSMEELTSSNEITFMERPFSSASSLYGGRPQYALGIFLDNAYANWGWGISGFNLKNGELASGVTGSDATPPETDGMGGAARLYFAPIMSESAVVHLGTSFSFENPSQLVPAAAGTFAPSSARYAGRSGPTASFAAAATTEDVTTYAFELAGRLGPLYAQAEYAESTYADAPGAVAAGEDDADVSSYYVQASWFITGEARPYDVKKGVFKNPKPASPSGAWEAKVRYDLIEIENVATEREATQIAAGFTWYINPSVRAMFEYISGEREDDVDGVEPFELDIISTRLQFSF